MRMNCQKMGLVAATVAALGILLGCASNRDMVDGKAEVPVPVPTPSTTVTPAAPPVPVICYLLEIEREDPQGNEIGEGYQCVDKATWDRNRVGEELVDASGKVVK